jgi:hypothetical protein
MREPTNGWQPIENCPRLDYEMYLVLVEHGDGALSHKLALWDPESGWCVFTAAWESEPIYWQHLPPLPGETMLPDEERQRLFDESLERMELEEPARLLEVEV